MILIRKVKEDFGWLGNMAPHPVVYEGKTYRTSEALFQSMRFDDEEVIEAIREQKSPMSAKMIAKKHRAKMVVKPQSEQDLANMRLVLTLKVEQHSLKDDLLATGDELIVEDASKRRSKSGLFWGAALTDGDWVGDNMLGHLWMELRESLRTTIPQRNSSHSPNVSTEILAG